MDTKPKPFCFVLMPFDKSFNDIYQLGIKESCTQAGAYCERVDEQDYHGTILERIPIELYYKDMNLSSESVILLDPAAGPNLNFTIHNASVNTLESDAFRIAVITSSRHSGGNQWVKYDSEVMMPTTKLPDGNYQHMAAEFDTLFPGQHTSLNFELFGIPSTDTDVITLRVFTPAGVRDYPVTLRRGPNVHPNT